MEYGDWGKQENGNEICKQVGKARGPGVGNHPGPGWGKLVALSGERIWPYPGESSWPRVGNTTGPLQRPRIFIATNTPLHAIVIEYTHARTDNQDGISFGHLTFGWSGGIF